MCASVGRLRNNSPELEVHACANGALMAEAHRRFPRERCKWDAAIASGADSLCLLSNMYVRHSACMHMRANGQQHLYCGCTVSAGGFANISISSARVRWTVVNDNRS
jgi:hypothetical protein